MLVGLGKEMQYNKQATDNLLHAGMTHIMQDMEENGAWGETSNIFKYVLSLSTIINRSVIWACQVYKSKHPKASNQNLSLFVTKYR